MSGTYNGKAVHATKVTLTGGAKEVFDSPPELDKIVEVTIEGRVTGVDYRVNDKTGDLEQIVRVKVIEVENIKTLSYPRAVTIDGKRIDPETGEVLSGEAV